jgi:hypothetical protein
LIDDSIKLNLKKILEQKMEMLHSDRGALEKLQRQITETEEQIYAIKKVLGDDDAQVYFNNSLMSLPVKPKDTKEGTVTHMIRLILEREPTIDSDKGVKLVQEECERQHRSTNINKSSWSQWSAYFKNGRYRMDANAYRRRYKQEPPY